MEDSTFLKELKDHLDNVRRFAQIRKRTGILLL